MSKKRMDDAELELIRGYLRDGYTQAEVGELVGRTTKSINNLVSRMGWTKKKGGLFSDKKSVAALQEQVATPAPKEKTLKDFTAREMIKYLYNLGYRIENNTLVCYVKQAVNVKDIITS